MNSTILNIKIDPVVKKKAKKIASNLGLTLSGVLNAYLRQFIRNKTVYFTLNEESPSPYLLKMLKESEEQIKRGEVYSFDDPKEAFEFLKKK